MAYRPTGGMKIKLDSILVLLGYCTDCNIDCLLHGRIPVSLWLDSYNGIAHIPTDGKRKERIIVIDNAVRNAFQI